MESINVTINSEPIPQKRHRHVSRGKFVQVYDPCSKEKAKFAKQCSAFAPDEPIDTAISVSVVFAFSRPKSHYGTGRNAGIVKASAPTEHMKKPDADNLAKFLLDALNGLYWRDDSIINNLTVAKVWAENGFTEFTVKTPNK